MAKNEERMEALNLYVYGDKNLSQISNMLSVTKRTLYRWKKEDKWEQKKSSYLKSGHGIKDRMLNMVEKYMNEIMESDQLDASKVDALSKLHKIAQEFGKNSVNIYSATSIVLKEMSEYIQHKIDDEEKINLVSEFIMGFRKYLEKKYR